MRRFLAVALLTLISACSTNTPTSPAQTVYAIQGTYASALTVAVAYKALPPCGQALSPVLCSDAAIVAKVQKADDVAYPALQSAQNIVRSPGAGANVQTAIFAATQAVSAFEAITKTLTIK